MRTCVAEANMYIIQNAKLVATTWSFTTGALLVQSFAPKLGDKYVWIQDEASACRAGNYSVRVHDVLSARD